MKIIVKTMEGLEEVLAQELRDLHLTEIEPFNRGVSCEGSWAQLYKCNYQLRTAIRVLVPIKDFTIETQQDLYDCMRTIDWSQYIKDEQTTFAIGATVFGELFTNSRFVTYRCKDAIVDQLSQEKGYRPNIELDNPDIVIQIHLAYNSLSILLDSTGKSLHLRNYKERAYKAPLNEVMAAGILKISGWDGQTTFVDPMCGSGTFTTEGLMIAANIPSGKFIERFCFENWADFRSSIWDGVKSTADAMMAAPKCEMIASDINSFAVRDLKKNLQKLPYRDKIKIMEADFLNTEGRPDSYVYLNPPYDKRIQMRNITEFYRKIGDQLKTTWQGSEAWVVSGNNQAMKNFGLKSSLKHKLDNGGIPSKLYKFELYGGSRKSKYQNQQPTEEEPTVTKPFVRFRKRKPYVSKPDSGATE